jgi:hypothetical protein
LEFAARTIWHDFANVNARNRQCFACWGNSSMTAAHRLILQLRVEIPVRRASHLTTGVGVVIAPADRISGDGGTHGP